MSHITWLIWQNHMFQLVWPQLCKNGNLKLNRWGRFNKLTDWALWYFIEWRHGLFFIQVLIQNAASEFQCIKAIVACHRLIRNFHDSCLPSVVVFWLDASGRYFDVDLTVTRHVTHLCQWSIDNGPIEWTWLAAWKLQGLFSDSGLFIRGSANRMTSKVI